MKHSLIGCLVILLMSSCQSCVDTAPKYDYVPQSPWEKQLCDDRIAAELKERGVKGIDASTIRSPLPTMQNPVTTFKKIDRFREK